MLAHPGPPVSIEPAGPPVMLAHPGPPVSIEPAGPPVMSNAKSLE
jgi:hypothetical protein